MSAQSITFYRHYICFAENLSRDPRVVCAGNLIAFYRADRLDLCLQQGKGRADHR